MISRRTALALFLSAVGSPSIARASTPSDELVIAAGADFTSLDPAVSANSSDQGIMAATYARLTSIDPSSGRAIPQLAHAWTMSPSGMHWTFNLRDEKFADGTPVTAQAVKYSFERIRKVGRATAESLFWLKSVDAVNERTIRFELTLPFPVLDRLLAVPGFSIVNPHVLAQHEQGNDNGTAWLSEHSAGSGPYAVASWQHGQQLVLERVTGGGPKQVVFRIVPDPATRRIELAKGDLDVVPVIGAREASDWAKLGGVSLQISRIPNTLYYLTLNTTHKPLNDPRVRRAIGLSIDYQALRKDVLAGNAVLLNGPIPPGFPGYDKSLGTPHRDLAAAKKLLAQAGVSGGFTVRYVLALPGPVSQFVQANLSDIGVRAQFQQLAPSALDAARTSGDFDIIYDGFTMDYPDPSIIMNLVFPTGAPVNNSRYSNSTVDRLLKEAFGETNQIKRLRLYDRAQRIIVDDAPIVPLFAPATILAYRSSVRGFRMNPYQSYIYDFSAVRKE